MQDHTTAFSTVRLDHVLLDCRADVQAMDPSYVVDLQPAVIPPYAVHGNEVLLHSLFTSLMASTCSSSSDHSASVTLTDSGGEVIVDIRDSGMSMGAVVHERPTGRSGALDQQELDLAVATRIAELHNGHVKKRPGSGFVAHLPTGR